MIDIVTGELVLNQHELMWVEITGVPGDAEDISPGILNSREVRLTTVRIPWFDPGTRRQVKRCWILTVELISSP